MPKAPKESKNKPTNQIKDFDALSRISHLYKLAKKFNLLEKYVRITP